MQKKWSWPLFWLGFKDVLALLGAALILIGMAAWFALPLFVIGWLLS